MVSGLTKAKLTSVSSELRRAGVPVDALTEAELIAGGRSNLTFRIGDTHRNWVLRMPPKAGRTPSAHDVAREHRVTLALTAHSNVPVPRPILLCSEEDSQLGGPYTVSDFVQGASLRTAADLEDLDDLTLRHVVDDFLAVLANLHRADVNTLGLSDFGRPHGYAARQLRRWTSQWKVVGDPSNGPAADALVSQLAVRLPEQKFVGVVHGDYRLDNTLVRPGEDRAIGAVLDWELSTIGDPVADVALMCAYRHQAFDLIQGVETAWTSSRLPEPADLAARYVAAGGVSLDGWDEHLGLAYFKIAVIAAGIAYRNRKASTLGVEDERLSDATRTFLALGLASMGGVT